MIGTSQRPRACWGALAATLFFLPVPGCRKDDDGVRVQTLEGKVEKVVVNPDGTGELTVAYFSEKHNQEVIGTGLVTKKTEILINGVLATLEDIREGERLRGEVRVEKKAGEKTQTVLKIYVDRPKPVRGSG